MASSTKTKSIDDCLDDLFKLEVSYFDLERDYILYTFETAPSQNKAAGILDRDKSGLMRKIKRFDSQVLRHSSLKEDYQTFFEKKIGVDDLLTGYTQRVFGWLKNKKTTAEFLGVNRNTVAQRLREYFKGEYSYNTSVIREITAKIDGLSLGRLRKMYTSFILDETDNNINETSRRTGVEKLTVKKTLRDKISYQGYVNLFRKCNKRRITYPELEKWYVAALAAKGAKKLGISPGSFKTKINEYVKDNYNKVTTS